MYVSNCCFTSEAQVFKRKSIYVDTALTLYVIFKEAKCYYKAMYLPVGDSCETDVDSCAVDPCADGALCTDLTPAEQQARDYTFECSCIVGYEYQNLTGRCVGMYSER